MMTKMSSADGGNVTLHPTFPSDPAGAGRWSIFLIVAVALQLFSSSFAAVDWTAVGHGVNGVSVAANSDTELEVTMKESTSLHYIADPTIGGELRRSDTITMSFELKNIWMESGYDGDAVIGLSEIDGATSAGTYQLGLRVMDPFGGLPATVRVYPYIKYQGAILLEGALSLDTNVNWGIGLTWTPTGGEKGYGKFALTATNLSTLAVQTSAAHPADNSLGFSGTAWGVFGGLQNSTDTEVLRFKVTNPTYTQLAYPAALPANMRLWVPFGQSNSHGNNASTTNHWPANLYERTNVYRWVNGRWAWARVGDAIHNDTSAWPAFASALAAEKGYAVGIIDNTRGGTALTQWLPSAGVMYPILTNAVVQAMAALTTPILEGVLHQAGESDAGNATDAGNFGSNFATVMTALRTDLATPGLTNIVTRLHNWSQSLNPANVATIRAHQEALVHWIDLDDLIPAGNGTNGAGHLDIDGQLAVGQRAFMKRMAMLDGPAPAVAAVNAAPAIALNAAALAARPLNANLAVLASGAVMAYDPNSAWPTNANFSTIKPNGRLGRWRTISVIPGMTARQMLDMAYLSTWLDSKANTNAFDTTQFTIGRNLVTIKSGAVMVSPNFTSFVASEWRPFSNSNPSHGIMRANGTGYILKVDGGNSRIGIGTDAPTPLAKLHVRGSGTEDILRADNSGSDDMDFRVRMSTTPGAGSVEFLSEGADATAGFAWSTPPGRKMWLSRDGVLGGIATINAGTVTVNPSAYGAGWATSTNVPTQKDVFDKIQTLGGGGDLLAANNLSDVANAATARSNLGVAIGSNVQAWDADLDSWAGIAPSAKLSAANNLSDVANAATARSNLGLAIGSNVQAWDADLDSWAGIAPSAKLSAASNLSDVANAATAFNNISPNTTRGDVTRRGASGNERVALGARGAWIGSDGLDAVYLSPFERESDSEDFIGGLGKWIGNNTNSGSTSAVAAGSSVESGHPGGRYLRSNTTSASASATISYGRDLVTFGDGEKWAVLVFKILTLPTAGEDYALVLGFGDSITAAEPVDGAYFYCAGSGDANWQLKTSNNSVRTTQTTSTAVATGWQVIAVKVNAAGTAVSYYHGTTFAGLAQIGTDVTTNIPTGTTRVSGLEAHLYKIAGTGDRGIYVDLAVWDLVNTTSR